MRLALVLFLLAGSAAGKSIDLPGSACFDYAIERRGNDMTITCPGPWRFYTPPVRTVFATVRDWYTLCAMHYAVRTQAGVYIICISPVKRK